MLRPNVQTNLPVLETPEDFDILVSGVDNLLGKEVKAEEVKELSKFLGRMSSRLFLPLPIAIKEEFAEAAIISLNFTPSGRQLLTGYHNELTAISWGLKDPGRPSRPTPGGSA